MVVAITLLAAITFMLGSQSVIRANTTAGELELDQLRYIAEAGLAHARQQVGADGSCKSYTDIAKVDFTGGSYTAQVSPKEGSPVVIRSTAQSTDGGSITLERASVPVYEPADTVVIQLSDTSGKDTILDDFYATRNYGGGGGLKIESDGWIQRPVLQFDLDAIPKRATILSASLELRQFNLNAPGTVYVHRMTRDWVEGTRNGGGIADGATWGTFDGVTAWTQPGGDFDPSPYSAATVVSGVEWSGWDVTALVQDWVSGKVPNHGMLLDGDGSVRNGGYASRTTNNPNDAPKLTITYACECGVPCAGANGDVLMVVVDVNNLSDQEAAKRDLIQSWDFTVNLIGEDDDQATYDLAFGDNDAVFVSEDVDAASIDTKLTTAPIGVVTEEPFLASVLGFSQGIGLLSAEDEMTIEDNTHYITEAFATGTLAVLNTPSVLYYVTPDLAVDLRGLGKLTSVWALATIDTNGTTVGGTQAAGRRVFLPWGGNDMDLTLLSAAGVTIFRRSIEWAAGFDSEKLPIAHWELDETSGTIAVDSIGGNDGTLTGGPTWIAGRVDGALAFDYTDGEDYVDILDSPALENVQEGDYTLAAWFRPDSTPPGSGSDNDANYGILIKAGWHSGIYYTNGNRFAFDQVLDGDTSVGIDSGNTFSPGNFYHVAGVVDRSAGTQSIYVNGQPEGTVSFTPGAAAREYGTMTWKIGIAYSGGSGWGWPADGAIDDVRIYDAALTAEEIAALATPPGGSELVYVVSDSANLSIQEEYREKFMTDWGFSVSLMDDDATETTFASVFQGSNPPDVVYVSQEVSSTAITAKLPDTTAGIVNESRDLLDAFGFASSAPNLGGGMPPMNVDTTHYITSTLTNPVSAFSVNEWYQVVNLPVAPGAQSVGAWIDAPYTDRPALMAIAAGGELIGGNPAPGRRVQLPMGSGQGATPVDINGMTADGRTIIRRSIEWAAGIGADAGGGGGGGPGPGGCNGTYQDGFDSVSFAGSSGSIDWSANPWNEVGESDGPGGGDVLVLEDTSVGRPAFSLQVQDNNNGGEGVERLVDLGGAGTATLRLLYRREGLDNPNDYVAVYVSTNGFAGPWTELPDMRFGGGTDSAYVEQTADLTGYIGVDTAIRLQGSSNLGATDRVYFDDIEITCSP